MKGTLLIPPKLHSKPKMILRKEDTQIKIKAGDANHFYYFEYLIKILIINKILIMYINS